MTIVQGAAMQRPLSYADVQSRRETAQALAAERKRKTQAGALQARTNPRMEAASRAKSDARQKVQSIRDRIKIIKSLYAANPKEMARALAQVFKELKVAVKAFAQAGGQEMALAREAARSVIASDDPGGSSQGEADKAEDAQTETAQAARSGAGLYDDMVRAIREGIGREGLDFAKEVRGMAQKIKELLDAARGQALIRKPDAQTDEALQQAEEAFKALKEALDDMETDITRAVPTAGMMVSVAA